MKNSAMFTLKIPAPRHCLPIIILLIVSVFLAACAVQPVEQAAESPLAQPESPLEVDPEPPFESAEGTGGVRGRLFSSTTNDVVGRDGVSLPLFICPDEELPEDPNDFDDQDCFWMFETSSSPTALTDETGYFEFRDLEPGIYLFFVGDMTAVFAFYETEEERPIRFIVHPDEVTELGNIIVAYP